jgi:hypothetical protein
MLNRSPIICLIVPAILMIFFLPGRAQEKERGIILEAKLWTQQGDTTQCTILYINQYNLQFKLTCVDTSSQEVIYYSPKDLEGFSYIMSDEEVEFRSMPNPEDLGRIFLRVAYRGKVTLYQYLEINYRTRYLSFLVSYYIWDKAWKLPAITQAFEMESLLYHFSDCPELEYKIKTREYGLIQIREIISEYEACELTDDYEFFFE